jgi:hypothetical protein
MTLAIAWVRQSATAHELIFASDSRLSGGGNVDHCQKVFALPREDCCIAFAGCTMIAYPFILQLQNTITEYKKVFDRAVDITKMHGRVVSLLNRFVSNHEGIIPDDFESDLLATSFLFGGWSWKMSKFHIWRIFYDKSLRRYVAASTGVWSALGLLRSNPAQVAFVGDYIPDFLKMLRGRLGAQIKMVLENGEPVKLDYEPLTILAEMLSDPRFTDRKQELRGLIGGAPQVTKVYPFLRTMNYAVEWDVGSKFVYSIKGRVIADFELFTIPGLNPFTGEVRRPVRWRDDDFCDFDRARTARLGHSLLSPPGRT